MKIHPEGYSSIIKFFFFGFLFDTAVISLTHNNIIVILIVGIITLAIGSLIFNFFRTPERKKIQNDQIIFSPADGTIVTIEKIYDKVFFNAERIQISIFMSVTDVHINWAPVSGTIIYKRYFPGAHVVAFNPKSSEKNERSEIVIRTKNKQEILVRQVAGILARRVINYLLPEDNIKQFDEMGIIKFGSRLDVLLPIDAKILVNIGQKVKGIETALAEF